VSNYFFKIVEMQTRRFVYVLVRVPSDDVIAWLDQNIHFASRGASNLIFGTLSAQFKFNNNVQR